MNNDTTLTETQRDALRGLGVVLCYLHGSVALGAAGKESDVDVAALFERAPEDPAGATAAIVQALAGFVPDREMDVAILNGASPLLAQQVAAHGRLLFERAEGDDLLFRIRTMHEYESSRRFAQIGRRLALSRAGL